MINIPTDDLPTLDDSITYVRGNYNELFPTAEGRRKTIGNLPTRVHAELCQLADSRNLKLYEVVAGMLDFYNEYEAAFEDELVIKRDANKARR